VQSGQQPQQKRGAEAPGAVEQKPTAKRGQSAGIGSPLIGATTKKATAVSATAPTRIQLDQ